MNDDIVIAPIEKHSGYLDAEIEYLNEGTSTNELINTHSTSDWASGLQNIVIDKSLSDIFVLFMAYSFLMAFLLAVIFIFWGGLSYILANGQDDKISTAFNTIRNSIIGLIIVIFSIFMVNIIGKPLGFDFIDGYVLNYEKLTSMIQDLSLGESFDSNSSDYEIE